MYFIFSVLLLVFSTQKELSYEDYNKMSLQPQKVQSKPSSQPKKPKKELRKRKPKKNREEQVKTLRDNITSLYSTFIFFLAQMKDAITLIYYRTYEILINATWTT